MKLASHNSWSYGRPQRWWMKLFQPFSKCQNVDLQEQFFRGVRMFDLRLKAYNNFMHSAHGLVVYEEPGPGIQRLNNLARGWNTPVYVRVLLESRNPTPKEVRMFQDFCKWLESRFTDLRFFGGHGAHSNQWRVVYYQFKLATRPPFENHCSVASGFHPIPYLYALRHNREVDSKESPSDFLMQDFIQY